MLDCVHAARIYLRMDLCVAYNVIRNKDGSENKTAVGMYYSQLE